MRIKLILLATLLAVSPIISFATDYYITTSDLNIRTGPGTKYHVSFTLQKGDEVELLSKEGDWYKIKHLGQTGYVSSKYLKFYRTGSETKSNRDSIRRIVNNLLVAAYVGLTLFIGFIIYEKVRDQRLLKSVTNKSRGTKSERDLVLMLIKYGISKQHIFHDLYVEKGEDEFSQTDLVILTKVGIIVFEVKDYSGWIYGNGNQSQWTKVLAYGKQKYLFYNPIRQNNTHISELRRQLYQFENIPFYSVIVFFGDCVLKNINFVPNGTFIVKSKRVLEAVRKILRDNQPYIYSNENEIIWILREAVTNGGNLKNQTHHSENIKDMLGTHRIFD
ncbi:MAG TPA: NERD domain-containing protein [Ohtaekwangia sp.]|nr:NERD domain-containing protein [Ohtaekwangia sp.]